MDDTPLVYRGQEIVNLFTLPEQCAFKVWKPSFFRPNMSGLPTKFIAFYFFHRLGIFGNKSFMGIQVIDGDTQQIAASLLVVPTFYKWPFMLKQDVQFIAVQVGEKYRGHRLATSMMRKAQEVIDNPEVNYWYVTNVWNEASQRAALNSGLILMGEAKRERGLFNQKILHLEP